MTKLLFFSMSQTVPSLFLLTVHIISTMRRNKIDIDISSVPKEITEQMVPYMKALELCEFISSYGGIMKIKKKFSTDGFQRFFLHFFKLLDKQPHPKTRELLTQQLNAFKKNYHQHLDYFVPKRAGVQMYEKRLSVIDWPVHSLGICFDQSSDNTLDFFFFKSKFQSSRFMHIRCPAPVLPNEWIHYLPNHVNTNLLPHMDMATFPKRPFQDKKCVRNQFFRRLLTMTEAFVGCRNHEVLAYGCELLSRNDFFNHPQLHKYYLYVYGEIAVTLARCNIDYAWTLTFLNKAKEFATVYSQKLDVLLYQQKVYFNYDLYDKENIAFERIFKHVPLISKFYMETFRIHVQCIAFKIENYICQALCYKRSNVKNQKTKDLFHRSVTRISALIVEEKRFIYKCLAKQQTDEQDFKLALLLFDVYHTCLDKLKQCPTTYLFSEKTDSFSLQFSEHDHFLKIFFKHEYQPEYYNIFWFNREMDSLKKIYSIRWRMQNHERWGHVCFTLFLMFQVLVDKASLALDWLEQAMTIYEINNSARYQTCKHLKNKTIDFVKDRHDTTPRPCEIPYLLKENKKVAELVKLGILSANQRDATNPFL